MRDHRNQNNPRCPCCNGTGFINFPKTTDKQAWIDVGTTGFGVLRTVYEGPTFSLSDGHFVTIDSRQHRVKLVDGVWTVEWKEGKKLPTVGLRAAGDGELISKKED